MLVDEPASSGASGTESQPLRHRLFLLVLVFFAVLALAAAWKWSPLKVWLDVDRIVATLQHLGRSFGPLAAVGGFALALTLAVPLTFLTLVTIVAFGPLGGFFVCVAGALLGAAVSYWLGVGLGREVVRKLGGARVNALSQRLAQRGLLAVIAVRLVPVAPFAVVNMMAGASHIRLRHLLLGTLIGMTPGTLVMMVFVDQIIAAMRQPSPTSVLIVLLTLILIGLGLWGFRRWLRQSEDV